MDVLTNPVHYHTNVDSPSLNVTAFNFNVFKTQLFMRWQKLIFSSHYVSVQRRINLWQLFLLL